MTAPYVRHGVVHVPLPPDTVREILWRVGHALSLHTDEAALALLQLADSLPPEHEGWAVRAESITQANGVTMHLHPDNARALAATLSKAADEAAVSAADQTGTVFQLCGGCKHLRPDCQQTGYGTRCLDCWERDMEIHRDHTS